MEPCARQVRPAAFPRLRGTRRPRRGVALVYATVILIALVGLCSLAVDYGRVQLVRTELQATADAAARAAASGLATSTAEAVSRGQAIGLANHADGTPVTLTAADFQFGRWNPATKTLEASGTVDAVQVTARRVSARGTAVPLLFAALVGKETCDVSARAVAFVTTVVPAGVIGLNGVNLQTNSEVDSYDSSAGAYSAAWTPDRGNLASNGDITLSSSATVRGDARPGPGHAATGGNVTGSRAPLAEPVSAPPVTAAPYGPGNNDNANIPATYRPGQNFQTSNFSTVSLPAGVYYFDDFTLGMNSTLNVSGAATIYVTGTFRIRSSARIVAARPELLQVRVIGSGDVSIESASEFVGNLYAPESDVTVQSNAQFYGAMVGSTVDVQSSADIHIDEALLRTAGRAGGISLVR